MATLYSPHSLAHAPARDRTGQLNRWRLAGFASLSVPVAAAQMPLAVHLPAIYAQHFGLSLGVIGAIFLAERLWGAIADPLIGVLSDRTSSRFGRRRPWIVGGAIIFGLASLALFFPSASLVSPLYLGAAMFAIYLGSAMIQIPYLAWSGQISGEYHERTRIVTFQTVAAAAALLLVLILPTIIDQLNPRDGQLKLAAMGAVVIGSLIITVPLALRAFTEAPAATPVNHERAPLGRTITILFSDPLLRRVLLSDFAVTIGQSTRAGLIVFFVTAYMGLPQWASGLYLFQFVFGVVAGPIWAQIGYRIGKHRAAVAGELTQVAINLALLLVVPGQIALLLALTVAQGLAQGSGNLMLRSMVADVADAHRLRTGADRTALFFSAFSLSSKAGMAVAVGIALPLVGWFGFNPQAVTNTPEALHGLLWVFALGPAIAHLISAALIHGFPLHEAQHSEIRRRLEERDAALTPAE
ncbi:MFS transporter [Sphingomonadales bacterium 56]|jgi:glycoside/pentoside/hexuronide:cation symporter, GPH family|nr:MFS transporter [Sphingomonadales bacterium 56]MBY2958497.1 MFS transporter [Sphingomonadales bacterium 58]CAD7337178.1 Putative glycoside/cation symporter YagG [Sphingobium sp. S6]CAD7337226.1 Putative glycoside/cation symporter YagG [Sphingobium sp. S8]